MAELPKSRFLSLLVIAGLLLSLAALAALLFVPGPDRRTQADAQPQPFFPHMPGDIITREGVLQFVHQGSIFTLKKDGTFGQRPEGKSGLCVGGKWTEKSPGVYEIDGQWVWLNGGPTSFDDFRTM